MFCLEFLAKCLMNKIGIAFSNLIGGSLESPYWLLLDFCPKILGGGGDL